MVQEDEAMIPKAYSYIRFSTPEQARGDSLRRQTEDSEKVALRLGMELDDTIKLQDKGLSAFKGDHRTRGALGSFLQLVDKGSITPGSILIVEALDRLSREGMLEATNLMTSILLKGIDIYTAIDNKHFQKETFDLPDLIISAVKLAQGHEESEKKSKRLKSVWEHKRQDWQSGNGQKVITAKCPAWMKPSEDQTGFDLITERARAVELIYRMKVAGKGADAIAKELNQRNDIWKPPKSRRNATGGWMKSYVVKILNNKAVIGEFQPHKLIKNDETGKEIRVPAGDPIDYYPAAIDKDLFYQVQGQIRQNRELNGFAGGRTGKCNNLFVHIAKCGICGGPMHFIDKGAPPKGDKFLICDSARRGLGCNSKGVKYSEFEKLFFDNCEELSVSSIIPGEDETQARLNELDKMLMANNQRMIELDSEVNNLSDSIATTEDARVRELLEGRLIGALDDKDQLQAENQQHDKEVRQLSSQKNELESNMEQVKEVYQLLESAKEKDRINIRLKLRAEVRKLVAKIEIFPLLDKFSPVEEVEPGIVQWMQSKYIDKVRIRFRGTKKLRVLYLKGTAELE